MELAQALQLQHQHPLSEVSNISCVDGDTPAFIIPPSNRHHIWRTLAVTLTPFATPAVPREMLTAANATNTGAGPVVVGDKGGAASSVVVETEMQKAMSAWNAAVPDELLAYMFTFVAPRMLVFNIPLVCKRWQDICRKLVAVRPTHPSPPSLSSTFLFGSLRVLPSTL